MSHAPDRLQAVWQEVESHWQRLAGTRMAELFAQDASRGQTWCLEGAGLVLDYSKNRVDAPARDALMRLAEAVDLPDQREALFRGDPVNVTEHRSALHVLLRDRGGTWGSPAGVDAAEVAAVRQRAYVFANAVRDGTWRGRTGKTIERVVNIGIGGSDLGPAMACEALKSFAHPRLTLHFVANIDADALGDVLARADPETTLFIIASKTFTTLETLTNAHTARQWFLASGATVPDIARHFVAVSTNAPAVQAFGIDTGNMFGFWDWVGGRYSLWSAIGLPVMISIGPDGFDALLDGAHAMDRHFRSAPLAVNMPVVLAMLGIWYRNCAGAATCAVLPYSDHLRRLPAYLQQLDMESNGKAITLSGVPATRATAPVIWGEPGTNGQHAFFQLLHQGSDLIPVDFILPLTATHAWPDNHRLLVANCLAQSSALMLGRSEADVRGALLAQGVPEAEATRLAPHRAFPGNRPSNTILLPRLDPASLGALLALYEHKVFVQGVVWNINSFDQWGVELGKSAAQAVDALLQSGTPDAAIDASTASLAARWLAVNPRQQP